MADTGEGSPHTELASMRRAYRWEPLDETGLEPEPMLAFVRWFDEAVRAGVEEANAMVLATAGPDCIPSARTVLLKGVDAEGFVFYTNRNSRKAAALALNPHAALVFRWLQVHRQVVVGGAVEEVSHEESDAYFASWPRGSQLGAWASRQSKVIADRETLDRWSEQASARFADGPVPRPPFWGGYRLIPDTLELWQGRPDRLHDRLRYRRAGGTWLIERLSP